MSDIRIGLIEFVNSYPFRLIDPPLGTRLILCTPREMRRQMEAGQLDVTLLPTGAMIAAHAYRPIGAYSIGTTGRVLSLNLFSRRPMREIVGEKRPTFLTVASVTTARLVQLLCKLEFGEFPNLTAERDRADAVLLIGDEAMDDAQSEARYPCHRDVSQWWFEQTGLPFVFARWVATEAVPNDAIDRLCGWLAACVTVSMTRRGREMLVEYAESFGWPTMRTELYFDLLQLQLSEEHLKGIEEFTRLAHLYGTASARDENGC